MKKGRTSFFTALVLLLTPSLLYFLLSQSGENRYELPVYFTEEIAPTPPCGTVSYPYSLFSNPEAAALGVSPNQGDMYLFYYAGREHTYPERGMQRLTSLLDSVEKETQARCILLSLAEGEGRQAEPPTKPLTRDRSHLIMTREEQRVLFACVFFTEHLLDEGTHDKPWVIIADRQGRIRGFFNPLHERGIKAGYDQLVILKKEDDWKRN